MKKLELTSALKHSSEESFWNSRKIKIESEIAVAKSEDSFENSWNDQASYWKSYVRTCVNPPLGWIEHPVREIRYLNLSSPILGLKQKQKKLQNKLW